MKVDNLWLSAASLLIDYMDYEADGALRCAAGRDFKGSLQHQEAFKRNRDKLQKMIEEAQNNA